MLDNNRSVDEPTSKTFIISAFTFTIAWFSQQVFVAVAGKAYGYHRDELYYFDCARHLSWGYIDFPPFSPVALWMCTHIFADGRWLTANLIGVTIAMGAPLAREFGGGRWAQLLTCLTLLFAPFYLSMGSFYSMNPFDCLFWIIAFWLLARIINTDNAVLWLPFGFVAGLALMNKYTAAIYLIVVLVAMAATPLRSHYGRVLFWVGLAIAAFMTVPNLVWQFSNGWPTLEFISSRAEHATSDMGPATFIKAQIMWMGPAAIILWLTGIGYGLAGKEGTRYRYFAIVFIALFLFFACFGFEPYYLAAAYPAVIALGAVCLTRASKAAQRLSYATAAFVVLLGIVLAPNAVPILHPKVMTTYQWQTRMPPPPQPRSKSGRLAPALGDRMGWKAMAEGMYRTFNNLSPEDKAACVILTSNRFEAGALNQFGGTFNADPAPPLPPAISGNRNGYLWGPGDANGAVVLTLGLDKPFLEENFESVVFIGYYSWPYVMAEQDDKPIYLCRNLKEPMNTFWPKMKAYW